MVEFALLDMSYKMLSSRAKTLIQRISVFKKAFPYEALKWMMKGRGKFKSIDKEIEELIHWGLIIKIEDEQDALYQVHTLVKDFMGEKVDKEQRKKWLIKAAQFYENLVKTTESLWDLLDARELYFAAEEYNEAGEIVANVSKYLHRWGFIELIRWLNEETIKTASGTAKGMALHHLGIIHQDQGEYEKAIEKYMQSLKIKEQLGDKGGIAITLHQLGMIHQDQGEYEKAIEKYNQSMKIFEELGDKRGMASTLGQLGNINYLKGEYDKAIEKYNQSMKIFEELGNKGGIAITLHQLGMIHQDQGEYEKAIEKYNQSLKIKEELGNKEGIAITLGQMGRIFEERKEYKEAIKNYVIALSIFEYLNSPYKNTVKAWLNELKEKIGEEAFERYHNEALEELKKEGKI
jgi:tetratricopeptide (TPR) repeat protein